MRLRVDERARVPFALVGVLLLVASAGFSAALHTRALPPAEPRADEALRTAQGEARSALHAAVRHAARDAARSPVVTPADSPWGMLLTDDPFRDSLRLRIYLAAARTLEAVHATAGDTRADVSLPRPDDPTEAREALERVSIESRSNGSAMAVRIENVSVALSRAGVVRDRRTYSPALVVATPVLGLHRSVERYDRRLQGPAGVPTRLGLTLTVLAWVRGLAQRTGAPVDNVVGNHHLAALTNRALIAEQRAVFGTADSRASTALGAALLDVARTDLGGAIDDDALAAELALDDPRAVPSLSAVDLPRIPVSVDGSADAAAASLRANDSRRVRAALARTDLADAPEGVSEEQVSEAESHLAALRDRVADVSVHVRARDFLERFPARRLRDRIRTRLAADGSATRGEASLDPGARAAVTRAYRHRVLDHLRRRANASDSILARLREQLDALRAGTGELVVGDERAGVVASVDADPAYLRVERANGTSPALAARNVNWFTVGTGDVADAVAGGLPGLPNGTRGVAGAVVERELDRVVGAIGTRVPASRLVPRGLPVAPVPGSWVVTVNGWTVEVRGGYRRFAASAPGAAPLPAPNVSYVRRSATITLDVDGDGTAERLGRNRRLGVDVTTATMVIVPKGPRGVGDRGRRTEQSAGWGTGNGSARSSGSGR